MAITYDPAKREWALRERGLDFEQADEVFAELTIDIPDLRRDYGEPRINSVGHLRGRIVIVCWTPRGPDRHVISMRKANGRERRATGSDLKKVDAYVLRKEDYDEIPKLTEEDFKRGVWHIDGVPVKRGRPKLTDAKQPVSLRLDPDVLAHFRRTGRGWQGRINAVLRKAAKLPKEKRKRA
jgi:uncharacterized DUF497 family protein